MKQLSLLFARYRQFLLYCLCGGTGVCTDYAVFHLLLGVQISPQPANAAGYVAGTLISFALNRAFTFNMRDQTGKRLALFLSTAAIGYSSSNTTSKKRC